MADPQQQPLRRLLPLLEGGDNEKLANLLALMLGGGRNTPGAAKAALGILVGIQDFLDYGDIRRVEMTWLPPQIFEALRSKHKQDLEAVIADAEQSKLARLKGGDEHGARIYAAVSDIASKLKLSIEKPPETPVTQH